MEKILSQILRKRIIYQSIALAAFFQLLTIPLGMFYFYLVIDVTTFEIVPFLELAIALVLLTVLFQVGILFILMSHIRRGLAMQDTSQLPSAQFVQDIWVEIVNFPFRFSSLNGIGITLCVFFLPLLFYLYMTHPDRSLLIHLSISGVMTACFSLFLQFEVFSRHLDSTLRQIEHFYAGMLNFRDPRTIRVSILSRLIFTSIVTIASLATYIVTLSINKITYIYEQPEMATLALSSLKFEIVIITLIIITVGLMMIYLITSIGTASLRNISDQMYEVRSGLWELDLVDAHTGVCRDEITEIITTFYEMMKRLQDFVAEIKAHSGLLDRHGQKIMVSGRKQTQNLNNKMRLMSSLNLTHEQMIGYSTEIAESAARISSWTGTIFDKIDDNSRTLDQMQSSVEIFKRRITFSEEKMMDLNTKLGKISEVINLINKIADQTKIIAFNASIEAASNTTVGIRFNVIAEQIRSLTLSITESTASVQEIVEDLQSTARTALRLTKKEIQDVDTELKAIEQAQASLDQIWRAIAKTGETVQHFKTSTNYQRDVSLDVNKHVKNLVSSGEKAKSKCENITNSGQKLMMLGHEMSTQFQSYHWRHSIKPRAPEDVDPKDVH